MKPHLDWSAYDMQGIGDPYAGIPTRGGAYAKAVAVCIGSRQCQRTDRKGVMCPSFRITDDPLHSTRGRVEALKTVLNGDAGTGPDDIDFATPALAAAMDLCIGCKGCKKECPNGVDMALLRTEWLAQRNARDGVPRRARLFAQATHWFARWPALGWLVGLRNRVPALAALGERWLGISRARALPVPSAHPLRADELRPPQPPPQAHAAHHSPAAGEAESTSAGGSTDPGVASPGRENPATAPGASSESPPDPTKAERTPANAGENGVALFVDSFTATFEPDNARAALEVLRASGYRAHVLTPAEDDPTPSRPLCSGRAELSFGLVAEARAEARRLLAALTPAIEAGTPIVGLEPSCVYMLKDEFHSLGLGGDTDLAGLSRQVFLFEEFIAREHAAGRLKLALRPPGPARVLVHGHCHQKAFGGMKPMKKALALIPGIEVEFIEAGCCGMAGSFGIEAEHHAISLRMAEADLLPAVRASSDDTRIVADGFSCRQQIRDGSGRNAVHAAVLLREALIEC